MGDGAGPCVDYGRSQDGVACDKGSVRVDKVLRVPCCTIRADLGRVICVCLHRYGGVWVFVGLTAAEMGGVF